MIVSRYVAPTRKIPARGPGLLWNPLALAPEAPEETPLMDVCEEVAEDVIFECSLKTLCMLIRETDRRRIEDLEKYGVQMWFYRSIVSAGNKRSVEKSGVVECRPSFCFVAAVSGRELEEGGMALESRQGGREWTSGSSG